MTRIRTGNRRRKRALQRVADMNALPGNLQIMSIHCHNVTVASQQFSDILRDVTKKIADAFRLPPEFVTSGPRLDTREWDKLFASGGIIASPTGRAPVMSHLGVGGLTANQIIARRAREHGFTPAPGVIPGLWIKDGYPELTTNQMLAEIGRIA